MVKRRKMSKHGGIVFFKAQKRSWNAGIEPNRVSIETLGYPFGWVEDIVKEFGFSICLDIGHILLYGQDLKFYLNKYLPETSIIHLHGFQNGIDHLGIDRLPDPTLKSNLLTPSQLPWYCFYRGLFDG